VSKLNTDTENFSSLPPPAPASSSSLRLTRPALAPSVRDCVLYALQTVGFFSRWSFVSTPILAAGFSQQDWIQWLAC